MYDQIEFVLACGGLSTRNFPHSKGLAHKCLLPFGDIRLIDYVLGEIIRVGGHHITFVCSDNETVESFKKALAQDDKTVEKLRAKNRSEIADVLQSTFLPKDVDLKFVIQDKPVGTAHVLYNATKVSEGRHVAFFFPDDIIVSKNEDDSHLKRLLEEFVKDEHQILLTGIEKEDVSNNGILANGRLQEKPKNPANHIGIYSPMILPKELMAFIRTEWKTRESEILNLGHEWYYVDAINSFLDNGGEAQGFFAKSLLKRPEDVLLDTGALPLYEESLLFALLKLSRFKAHNRDYVNRLLKED